eukprot:gnl/MRDRNA2_/MRDRNA2_108090_c0_seq1.p1 gnl/MRDRNA2_/MRDRNA2_108090_c0~~gnl/MRDRNA2_/MRDRNA2_108090_c0_seq1.p1  ORF type:complete len:412 (-),score=52.94 gnl/MRDRNA2_/MRDRNA2_108090_c0_seq1:97-1332(-)
MMVDISPILQSSSFELAVGFLVLAILVLMAMASSFRQQQKGQQITLGTNIPIKSFKASTQFATYEPIAQQASRNCISLPDWLCICLVREEGETQLNHLRSRSQAACTIFESQDSTEIQTKIQDLVQGFHVRAAWDLLCSKDRHHTKAVSESNEMKWVRCMGPALEAASERFCVPPVEKDWIGPVDTSGEQWQCQTWFRWIGGTRLRTLTCCTVPAPLMHVMAMYHEVDLARKWFPFVASIESHSSVKIPAVLFTVSSNIPILPWWTFAAVIHRGFANATGIAHNGGIVVVEFTPDLKGETNESWCGVEVPPWPTGARETHCELTTILVESCGADSCKITFAMDAETKVPRWLLPDRILCAFNASATRKAFEGCLSVLRDFEGYGYCERMTNDAEGFYCQLQKCLAEQSRSA